MEDQHHQVRERRCAAMQETLNELRTELDTLPLSRTDRNELFRDVLTLLNALANLQPDQGRAAFARFPEMVIFETLSSEQRRRVLAILD